MQMNEPQHHSNLSVVRRQYKAGVLRAYFDKVAGRPLSYCWYHQNSHLNLHNQAIACLNINGGGQCGLQSVLEVLLQRLEQGPSVPVQTEFLGIPECKNNLVHIVPVYNFKVLGA